MRERIRSDGSVLPRRRTSGRALALSGAFLLSVTPFLIPIPAQAAVNTEAAMDQDLEDLGDDSTSIEPLATDALVLEEGIGEDQLRVSFYQRFGRAQIKVNAQQWAINSKHKGRDKNPDDTPRFNPPIPGNPDKPGDITRPWGDQKFKVTGLVRSLMGTSDKTQNGDVLFNNTDPNKPPGSIVEFQGACNDQNQISVIVSRIEGITRRVLIPCGSLVRYTARLLDSGAKVK